MNHPSSIGLACRTAIFCALISHLNPASANMCRYLTQLFAFATVASGGGFCNHTAGQGVVHVEKHPELRLVHYPAEPRTSGGYKLEESSSLVVTKLKDCYGDKLQVSKERGMKGKITPLIDGRELADPDQITTLGSSAQSDVLMIDLGYLPNLQKDTKDVSLSFRIETECPLPHLW